MEPGFEFRGKDPELFLKQKEEKEVLNLEEKKYNYIQNLTLGKNSEDMFSLAIGNSRETTATAELARVGGYRDSSTQKIQT